jgi:hypothetical protein
MRHVGSLIAALVIAPLAWLLIAYGQDRSAQAFANAQSTGAFDATDFLRPVLLLSAAGLLIGLVATLRISPVGATVAGVGYAASYVMLLLAPDGTMRLFRHHLSVAGRSADLSTPLRTGTALLLGATMVVAVVSVSRWRRWPRAEATGIEILEPARLPADRPLGADGLTGPDIRDDRDPFATGRTTEGVPVGHRSWGDDGW